MLDVSASHIETDFLVDFPLQDRFIKLPIQNYLSLINITPIRPQIALVNAINDPLHRFVVACLRRFFGFIERSQP